MNSQRFDEAQMQHSTIYCEVRDGFAERWIACEMQGGSSRLPCGPGDERIRKPVRRRLRSFLQLQLSAIPEQQNGHRHLLGTDAHYQSSILQRDGN
jgi:hypothetical protein